MEADAPRVTKAVSGFTALAYDSKADQVGVVKAADGSVRLFRGAGLGAARTRSLPSRYVRGTGRLVASFDSNGILLLRREGSNAIQRAAVTAGYAPRSTISSGDVDAAAGFVATNRGSVVAVIDGRLVELKPDGTRVANSDFAGVPVSGRLVSIIRPGVDLPADLRPVLMDEQLNDPGFPEMAGDEPPANSRPLPSYPDDEADAQMDAMAPAGP
jgi:hypothetical protein